MTCHKITLTQLWPDANAESAFIKIISPGREIWPARSRWLAGLFAPAPDSSKAHAPADVQVEVALFRDVTIGLGLGTLLDLELERGDGMMGVLPGSVVGEDALPVLDEGQSVGDVGLELGIEHAGGRVGVTAFVGLDVGEAGVLVAGADEQRSLQPGLVKDIVTDARAGGDAVSDVGQRVVLDFKQGGAHEPVIVEAEVVAAVDALVVGALLAVGLAEIAEVVEEQGGGGCAAGEFGGGVEGWSGAG